MFRGVVVRRRQVQRVDVRRHARPPRPVPRPAADVEKVALLNSTFRYDLPRYDQTLTPIGECGIEFVVRKRSAAELEAEEKRLEHQRARQVNAVRIIVLAALLIFAALLALIFFRALRDISLDREAEADTAERLRGLLADRELLLAEVNHRVKNSLAQVASMVRLQARAVDHPDARDALEKTLDRIMAVGRVHEQLYRADDAVGLFDAGRYAEGLARDLVESLGREDVRLETEIEPVMLEVRHAVPLALILNELITNALKYGCPADRPSRIKVGFETEGELLRLSVADDGDGLPSAFSPAASKSLGMRAIQVLARQLGGSFEIGHPKAGASFAVVFPRSS